MEYQRKYKGVIGNYPGLSEVRARFLEVSDSELTHESYEVQNPEHNATYESLEELLVSRFLPDATGCRVSLATEKTRFYIFGNYIITANTSVTVDGLSEGQAESLVRHVAKSRHFSTG